jgi:hypothetical protein
VPSVRFSRDKRGYEYVYLVHTPTRRGKPGRTRVLYWYRTPPGVRIGRQPFDEEVQRALERQNPGIEFAWDAIINTPMPPPDMTEYWRERRRADKAARQERRAIEAEGAPDGEPQAGSADRKPDPQTGTALAPEAEDLEQESLASEPASAPANGADAAGAAEGQSARKRRRRRGGRRRRGAGVEGVEQGTASAGGTPGSVEAPDASDVEGQSDDEESASEEK